MHTYIFQIFKPDDKNGMEIQSEVDALLERQRRDNSLTFPKTPASRYYQWITSAGTLVITETKVNKLIILSFFFLRQKLDPEISDMLTSEEASKADGVDEDSSYSIFISYIQIYNNYIYDLLEETQEDAIKSKWVSGWLKQKY